MKRIFLIDKENTGERFLQGINTLTAKDTVIIFHWEDSGAIKTSILETLSKSKAAIEIKKFHTHRKNALDFQICTYLGYLYGINGSDAKYYIVSNDRGYEAAVEFLKTNLDSRINISIVPNVDVDAVSVEDALLIKLLTGHNSKVRRCVKQGIKQTQTLNDFHSFLQKNISRDYHDVYMKVKPVYPELKACC